MDEYDKLLKRITGIKTQYSDWPLQTIDVWSGKPFEKPPVNFPNDTPYRVKGNPNWIMNYYDGYDNLVKGADTGIKAGGKESLGTLISGNPYRRDEEFWGEKVKEGKYKGFAKNNAFSDFFDKQERNKNLSPSLKSQIGKTFPSPPQRSEGTRSTQATRNLPNRERLLEDAFKKVRSTGRFLPSIGMATLPLWLMAPDKAQAMTDTGQQNISSAANKYLPQGLVDYAKSIGSKVDNYIGQSIPTNTMGGMQANIGQMLYEGFKQAPSEIAGLIDFVGKNPEEYLNPEKNLSFAERMRLMQSGRSY